LSFCTVTDFFGQDKASGIKFCRGIQRRPGHGISHFGELCSPRSPVSNESARGDALRQIPIDASPLHWRRARRQGRGLAYIGNACPQHVWIYIRPSPKTDVLVEILFTSEQQDCLPERERAYDESVASLLCLLQSPRPVPGSTWRIALHLHVKRRLRYRLNKRSFLARTASRCRRAYILPLWVFVFLSFFFLFPFWRLMSEVTERVSTKLG